MSRLANETQCKCGAVLGIGAPVLPDMWEAHNRICPQGHVCAVKDCGKPATPAGECSEHLTLTVVCPDCTNRIGYATSKQGVWGAVQAHTCPPVNEPQRPAQPMTASEKYLEAQTLIELGESPAMAVARLQINPANAARWYRRNGHQHTAQLMETLRTLERKQEWTPQPE